MTSSTVLQYSALIKQIKSNGLSLSAYAPVLLGFIISYSQKRSDYKLPLSNVVSGRKYEFTSEASILPNSDSPSRRSSLSSNKQRPFIPRLQQPPASTVCSSFTVLHWATGTVFLYLSSQAICTTTLIMQHSRPYSISMA